MSRLATILTLGIVLVAARAQGDELRDEARKHRDAAKALFSDGKFAEALAEYRTAYQLVIDPDLLFNIGLCQESLHDNAGAIESYTKFLESHLKAKDRTDIEARIAALKKGPEPAPAPVNLNVPAPAPEPAATPAVATATSEPSTPLLRRWYVWAGAAALVVVVAVAIGIALSVRPTNLTFDGVVAK